MTLKRALLVGCCVLAGLGLVVLVAGAVWTWNVMQDPVGMGVALEAPDTVTVGDEMTLRISVTNERPDEPLHLEDIDIERAWLGAFVVLAVEPQPKSVTEMDFAEVRVFEFDLDLPPRQTVEIDIRVRAIRPGVVRGDVDVSEGARFVTVVAETRILDP